MNRFASLAALGTLALALAACGSAEDASTEPSPDTVEVPAEEALEPVTEEPVADEAANGVDEVAGPPAVSEEDADAAAENAAEVAEQAEAAANALDQIDQTTDEILTEIEGE